MTYRVIAEMKLDENRILKELEEKILFGNHTERELIINSFNFTKKNVISDERIEKAVNVSFVLQKVLNDMLKNRG